MNMIHHQQVMKANLCFGPHCYFCHWQYWQDGSSAERWQILGRRNGAGERHAGSSARDRFFCHGQRPLPWGVSLCHVQITDNKYKKIRCGSLHSRRDLHLIFISVEYNHRLRQRPPAHLVLINAEALLNATINIDSPGGEICSSNASHLVNIFGEFTTIGIHFS